MDLVTASATFGTEVREGFGPVRKTKASAAREARLWNESGDGSPYHWARRTNVTPERPARWEECVAEVRPVEGGFVCAYVTTITPTEEV